MTTHELVRALVKKLFEAESRRLNATISKLNQLNKQRRNVQVDGFLYQGQFYLPAAETVTIKGKNQLSVVLHSDFHGEMDKHIKDKRVIEDERQFISQTLFSLLASCRTKQEIRDALPECLVDCIEDLVRIPRTQEPAWTLQSNPRALRQYQKILPKMEIYSAARLLY